MKLYAVVEAGGKQYMVQPEDKLRVERVNSEVGEKIELGPVLAVSDGNKLVFGKPELSNAKVSAVVLEHLRGPKLISFKKKRRKGYALKKGHRQELTLLKIDGIELGASE